MEINVDKTKVMTIRKNNKKQYYAQGRLVSLMFKYKVVFKQYSSQMSDDEVYLGMEQK